MADVIRLSKGEQVLIEEVRELYIKENEYHKKACEKYNIPTCGGLNANDIHDLLIIAFSRTKYELEQSIKEYECEL